MIKQDDELREWTEKLLFKEVQPKSIYYSGLVATEILAAVLVGLASAGYVALKTPDLGFLISVQKAGLGLFRGTPLLVIQLVIGMFATAGAYFGQKFLRMGKLSATVIWMLPLFFLFLNLLTAPLIWRFGDSMPAAPSPSADLPAPTDLSPLAGTSDSGISDSTSSTGSISAALIYAGFSYATLFSALLTWAAIESWWSLFIWGLKNSGDVDLRRRLIQDSKPDPYFSDWREYNRRYIASKCEALKGRKARLDGQTGSPDSHREDAESTGGPDQ